MISLVLFFWRTCDALRNSMFLEKSSRDKTAPQGETLYIVWLKLVSETFDDDFELNNGHCPSDTSDLGHIVFNTAGDGRGKILESFRPTACMLNFRRSAFNALFSNLDKSPGGASPKNGYACLSSAYQVKQDCFNRSCSEKASLSERFAAKKCESMLTQTAWMLNFFTIKHEGGKREKHPTCQEEGKLGFACLPRITSPCWIW